jgi:hypothetical protein
MWKFLLYFLIANTLFLLSNIPFYFHIEKNPQDRVFPLVHSDWSHDFYSDVSTITQGKNGYWLKEDPYTLEETKPGVFHFYFILVGKLAWIFHLEPIIAYHLVRIVSAELFFVALWLLSRKVLLPKYSSAGIIFALLGTIAPTVFYERPLVLDWFPQGLPWWLSLDALERLNTYPHHMFGQAMLLFAFYYFFSTSSRKAAVFAGIGSFLFPPILLPLLFCVPGSVVFISMRNRLLAKKYIPVSICITAICLGVYMLLKWQTRQGFPWDQDAAWELGRWNMFEPAFNGEFYRSFGILPLLALPGIAYALYRGKLVHITIALWALMPFVMLPFVDILSIPKIRLLQTSPFVPLGLCSAYTLSLIPKKRILRYVPVVLISIFLITAVPVSYSILKQRIQTIDRYITAPDMTHVHLPKTEYEAIQFIQTNIPAGSGILADERIGTIIPAFAPVKSYFGHFVDTKDFDLKRQWLQKFYSGTFSSTQVAATLALYNIHYIYYGIDEQRYTTLPLQYEQLSEIFRNGTVKIYRVK